ncbi:hypothetical protein PIB30_084158 [Stylosanthes scabra]|uniref:Uncharacterized protein n=1 Tax=Stylosanthes scabra TaxID=79078 RepID=A0ABU6TUM5_9FABA|nr:hypothetical protein [Stylosanthes scabra]
MRHPSAYAPVMCVRTSHAEVAHQGSDVFNYMTDQHMATKGKAKIHQPPTRFSLRLAALKACQPIDKAETSSRTPAISDLIIISSDSEEDLDPQGSNSEEEEP